jgi:hypothetical protein
MKREQTLIGAVALVGAFMFLLEGCGDNPPNPCFNLKETSAAFRMEEYFLGVQDYWKPYDTDTFI